MLAVFLFLSFFCFCHALFYDVSGRVPKLGEGVQLPLEFQVQARRPTGWRRNDGAMAAIGLGDVQDVTYNVVVQVGNTETPLVIDTGSSDLWLISDSCSPNCPKGSPDYGDSRTGTHASGPIGTDTAGVAGLSVPDQSFAAIIDTNTTVLETGSAGILGLGFPPVSLIWRQRLEAQLGLSNSMDKRESDAKGETTDIGTSPLTRAFSLGRPPFPSFTFLESHKRQMAPDIPPSTAAVASFATYGPLLSRLITQQVLAAPLIATTLQRDTIAVGGNAGQLSLGGLPAAIRGDSLTWLPVRAYTTAEGGFPPSPDAPNEVYPLVWEIPIDDVYFDGVKLARSELSSPSISLSGLLDTGNSLIRGPQDVVSSVFAQLGSPSGAFDCRVPHNLTFEIGGVLFPVDPRNFVLAPSGDSLRDFSRCTPALAATDPPGNGQFLYSWSLGVPFLKSALVAFYYGNLTHPSQDPPRVGLLSTVPPNAADALLDAVRAAAAAGGVFPATSNAAPTSVTTATVAGVAGVPQVVYPGFGSGQSSSGAERTLAGPSGWLGVLAVSLVLGRTWF